MEEKDIKTAKQAYNYALQVNQPKSYDQNFKGNRNYSRQNKQLISKEKTPKWLENREAQSNSSATKDSTTKDEKLEKDRKAFLERLNKNGRRAMSNEKFQEHNGCVRRLK